MPSPVQDGEVDGNFLTYGVELYAWTKKTGKLLRGYPVCTKPSLFAVSPGCSRALDYSRFEASFARSSLRCDRTMDENLRASAKTRTC